MPFHTNQFGLEKIHWNLETSSAVVEFLPPYRTAVCMAIVGSKAVDGKRGRETKLARIEVVDENGQMTES